MAIGLMPYHEIDVPQANAPWVNSLKSALNTYGTAQDIQGKGYANQLAKLQAQYAPITIPAEASSKLAYANLMGPQFLAKLMSNSDLLANIPEEQKAPLLNYLKTAGTTSYSGLGNQGMVNPFSKAPNLNPPALSSVDQNAINNMQPGDSYVIGGQGGQSLPLPQVSSTPPKSFAENAGMYSGVKKEGEESGKIRANDIKELNDIVQDSENRQTSLDNAGKLLSSPVFEQIRQLPAAGQHEIAWYSRYGTPEQQQVAGQFLSTIGEIVTDSASRFKGSFRRGEQSLLMSMKPSTSDTIDNAKGKWQALNLFNKMLSDRSSLTSQYMNQFHINKLEAMHMADKQLNADKLRDQINDAINPKIRIRNKKTGEIRNLSPSEARKLGVTGV